MRGEAWDDQPVAHVLFPLGVRLSTWIALAVFLALGVRDRRYWWAAAAWVAGFETLYQATTTAGHLLHSGFHPGHWWVPVIVFSVYLGGVAFVVVAADHGARPSWPLLTAALLVWGLWIATGFHVNAHTMADFDPASEVLNELAKTLWAAAYLVPLLAVRPLRLGRVGLQSH